MHIFLLSKDGPIFVVESVTMDIVRVSLFVYRGTSGVSERTLMSCLMAQPVTNIMSRETVVAN